MTQDFLSILQSGSTAELADVVRNHPELVNWRDAQGVSALLWSIYTGQTPARDLLLAERAAHGASLDIFEAAALGDTARLTELLDTDVAAAQSMAGDGWMALHLAAGFGTPETVRLLLERGAQIDAVSANAQRNQALHAALALGRNRQIVELLLDHGADPNATQSGGFTPIFSAAAANRRDLVELLLEHRANPHHRSDAGKSPADFCRERGHRDLAAWLEALQGSIIPATPRPKSAD